MIAGWARALTPDRLSEEQEALLAPSDHRVSAAQSQAEALGSYWSDPLWELLSDGERAKVESVNYPVGLKGLSELTGLSEQKIRYWESNGFIPARRTPGGHRKFYEIAAMRAFFLKSLGQRELTILRKVREMKAERLMAAISLVLADQEISSGEPLERETLRDASATLGDLSLMMQTDHSS